MHVDARGMIRALFQQIILSLLTDGPTQAVELCSASHRFFVRSGHYLSHCAGSAVCQIDLSDERTLMSQCLCDLWVKFVKTPVLPLVFFDVKKNKQTKNLSCSPAVEADVLKEIKVDSSRPLCL